MQTVSRRDFLVRSTAVAMGFAGLRTAMAHGGMMSRMVRPEGAGFGPLLPDPAGVFDMPAGFSYRVISRQGERMVDGLVLPGMPDGMAAFESRRDDGTPDGRTLIVRNHEIEDANQVPGPFGESGRLPEGLDASMVYDPGHGRPCRGGTTTLVYNTATQELESQHLSLAGTERNCAGGPTPWGTWITCEETVARADDRRERDHGWCFEVPARATPGLVRPVPLKAMGRFNHEAVCVDPATGVVYLTEDTNDGALYRFLPAQPGRLEAGGRLQALAVRGRDRLDTRNWDQTTVRVGSRSMVRWIDLDNVESPNDDLRYQGYEKGAARFARGEGMWWGKGAAYFACTSGGREGAGQLWRLTPGAGGAGGDSLELFIEPNDRSVLEYADNITFSPWGDIVVCEDGADDQFLLGVTPGGVVYKLGRNAMSHSELAGACFSPDGTTLFLNIQVDGLTLAITGPWERRP